MPPMRKGQIWNTSLNMDSQDIIGHEQGSTRPCLIISIYSIGRLVTVIPISKTPTLQKFPFTYEIVPDTDNGLTNRSYAMIFQIRSISQKRFQTFNGTIPVSKFQEIQDMVNDYLFC